MASPGSSEINAWVRAGGVVVAASERTRRALLAAYHRAQMAEGRTAWNTPAVYNLNGFVREQWMRHAGDRLVLNTMQEEALWRRVIAAQNPDAALLRPSLRRMARMAMEAHELLCMHAPEFLREEPRRNWNQDAEAFSRWLTALDEACRRDLLMPAARLPLELTAKLKEDPSSRPPLLAVGFDRVTRVQEQLFRAWGSWRRAEHGIRAEVVESFAALDGAAELEACAAWCRTTIGARNDARILVITQDAAKRRGEMERIFLVHANADPAYRFEFSLGVPLARTGMIRSAQLVLRWLGGEALDEAEIDWLCSNARATGDAQETAQLQRYMRELRRQGLQRMTWTLDALIDEEPRVRAALPANWKTRLADAQQMLASAQRQRATALDWAALTPRLLAAAGWPGPQSIGSIEFQAMQRFEQVLDTCGSLGFDGRRMEWPEFLAELNDAVEETLFAAESQDAPVLIAGPAEAAGLSADAVWFLGAHEDAWPARGSMHPLLPAWVQRDAEMPHASAQSDFELARTMTERIAASAPVVRFSFPRQEEGVDTRASRLVEQIAGAAVPLPAGSLPSRTDARTVRFEDAALIPIAAGAVRGGSSVLTAQSQCPLRGFAIARLDAAGWDAAEPGLTPPQRGQLLHEVLHGVWGGKPHGIRSLDELRAVKDLREFVRGHVERARGDEKFREMRMRLPDRYLALEGERLTRVVTKWLEYERERLPFEVEATEYKTTAHVAGLSFEVRLDRVDKLADGSMLVVDYKTGDVSPKAWELPRPDDVQLPLYAGYGLPESWSVGGLAFAKIRAGEACFAGFIQDAEATIGPVENANKLKKSRLQTNALSDWRRKVEELARDFLAGRSDVDPRDPAKTCDGCGLQTVCRIHERPSEVEEESDEDADA